ncbi:MAG: A/G-specific adenine glycosylase [Corynebacteriales bacterium]|nr:A/G-specific adenine glycosylase [Mycobacteriales bacterium]
MPHRPSAPAFTTGKDSAPVRVTGARRKTTKAHRTTAPPHHRTTAPPHHRTTAPPHHRTTAPGTISAVDALIPWYREHARELPWREPDVSPWAILVSEIMLQQTPVVRVLPAYRRWLELWPTPAALASDSPAEAVRQWDRLGYPRRALRLHACARKITDEHAGSVPSTVEELEKLPGVGAYTARAVAAFAFGKRAAPVDVNVRRVLARALSGYGDAGPATTKADFALMESFLPERDAPLFAAAVMELGATVCTSQKPRCAECPIVSGCEWHRLGRPSYISSRRRQGYEGTDRQARGRLLGVLRNANAPVPREELLRQWPDQKQGAAALESLVADGLASETGPDEFWLPH